MAVEKVFLMLANKIPIFNNNLMFYLSEGGYGLMFKYVDY